MVYIPALLICLFFVAIFEQEINPFPQLMDGKFWFLWSGR
jgi:hypothetical protein